MPVIEDLKNNIDQFKTLKLVTASMAEVSAGQIKTIRNTFERNRLFFEEMSDLYHSIKLSRSIQQAKEKKEKKIKNSKRIKTIHVALTSNQHFYGTLNYDVINKLMDNTRNSSADRIVIGTTGKQYLETLPGSSTFISLIYKNDRLSEEEMRQFIERVKDYDRVFVYYPKFISVLSQKVDVVDITHSPMENLVVQKEIGYIFEPELPKIVDFFEIQVKYLLFWRVLLENELSKTAARLISTNQAEEKADELIGEYEGSLRRAYQSLINSRLIETFSGIRKWRKNE